MEILQTREPGGLESRMRGLQMVAILGFRQFYRPADNVGVIPLSELTQIEG
jgi:hypothetical protein